MAAVVAGVSRCGGDYSGCVVGSGGGGVHCGGGLVGVVRGWWVVRAAMAGVAMVRALVVAAWAVVVRAAVAGVVVARVRVVVTRKVVVKAVVAMVAVVVRVMAGVARAVVMNTAVTPKHSGD